MADLLDQIHAQQYQPKGGGDLLDQIHAQTAASNPQFQKNQQIIAAREAQAPGFWSTLKTDIGDLPKNVMDWATGTNPIAGAQDFIRNVAEASWEHQPQAIEALKQGRYGEAIGHGLAGTIPMVGPMAAGAGEDIGEGLAGGSTLGRGAARTLELLAPFAKEPIAAGLDRAGEVGGRLRSPVTVDPPRFAGPGDTVVPPVVQQALKFVPVPKVRLAAKAANALLERTPGEPIGKLGRLRVQSPIEPPARTPIWQRMGPEPVPEVPAEAPPAAAAAPVAEPAPAPAPQAPIGNQAARRASVIPPETGIPEGVQRGVAARENLSQHIFGKSFAELGNRDRIGIDEMVTQGYGYGAAPESAPQPAPPVAPPPAQPAVPSPAPETPAAPVGPGKTAAQMLQEEMAAQRQQAAPAVPEPAAAVPAGPDPDLLEGLAQQDYGKPFAKLPAEHQQAIRTVAARFNQPIPQELAAPPVRTQAYQPPPPDLIPPGKTAAEMLREEWEASKAGQSQPAAAPVSEQPAGRPVAESNPVQEPQGLTEEPESVPTLEPPRSEFLASGERKSQLLRAEEIKASNTTAKAKRYAEALHGFMTANQLQLMPKSRWPAVTNDLIIRGLLDKDEVPPNTSIPQIADFLRGIETSANKAKLTPAAPVKPGVSAPTPESNQPPTAPSSPLQTPSAGSAEIPKTEFGKPTQRYGNQIKPGDRIFTPQYGYQTVEAVNESDPRYPKTVSLRLSTEIAKQFDADKVYTIEPPAAPQSGRPAIESKPVQPSPGLTGKPGEAGKAILKRALEKKRKSNLDQ